MSRIQNLASERGAILVSVVLIITLSFFIATLVLDRGVLWVSRHQAQNAADAGAMAGALARAYDDFEDPPAAGGVAALNATQVAGANLVWGASLSAPAVDPSFECPPEAAGGRCVKVNVFRDEGHGTALPTWFAPVLNITFTSQNVRATASARVLIANATDCLRPWAIPDKWSPEADYLSGLPFSSVSNTYGPPGPGGAGTGLTFPTSNSDFKDLGLLLPLSATDLTDMSNPIYRGSVVPLDLTGGYYASRDACNGQHIEVGDQVSTSTSPATVPLSDFALLNAQDSGAAWNVARHTIDGSCAPTCAPLSPRLVAFAVFDTELFQQRRDTMDWSACPGGVPCVSIVNIVGFFIGDDSASGYVTSYPGLVSADPPKLSADSSFLKAVTLVR